MSEIDWDNVKILAWTGSLSRLNANEPEELDIIKQTKTFIWVKLRERTYRLRKSDFKLFAHAYAHRPFVEFGIIKIRHMLL
jgi:hypothetical protein